MAVPDPVRVYVCGRLALEQGPAVVRESDLPGRQCRRLWAFLVLRRRLPVARDELAAAVWDDKVPDAWDIALNALVSRLRAALRPIMGAAIASEVGRYALQLPADVFVDVERARRALHEADRLAGARDHAAALAEARVAMEIAGRGFLAGEDLPWTQGQRRALAEIHVHALRLTAETELLRGHPELAERESEALVALDPLREEGYRLLVRALAARGNRAKAVAVLDECKRVLREQAGVAPSAETERLLRDLRDGEGA